MFEALLCSHIFETIEANLCPKCSQDRILDIEANIFDVLVETNTPCLIIASKKFSIFYNYGSCMGRFYVRLF